MKPNQLPFIVCTLILVLASCKEKLTPGKLVLRRDERTSMLAYFDENGTKVLGDFYAAYTDTITEYGIVADPDFVLIDKTGRHIYRIYPFDNGPDETSEGIYRIIDDGKIGFVDSATSKVLVIPKFACAFPFENGKAKVSFDCKKVFVFPGDEHPTWQSDKWFYINKEGKVVK